MTGLEILFSIIGLLITGTSVIISIIQYRLRFKEFQALSDKNTERISGTWTGSYNQHDELDGIYLEGNATMSLRVSGNKTIEGSLTIKYTNSDISNDGWEIEGGIKDNRFLELRYQTQNQKKIQFGSVMLELGPQGKLLGKLVGYGPNSKKMICGSILFSNQTR